MLLMIEATVSKADCLRSRYSSEVTVALSALVHGVPAREAADAKTQGENRARCWLCTKQHLSLVVTKRDFGGADARR